MIKREINFTANILKWSNNMVDFFPKRRKKDAVMGAPTNFTQSAL
ncbi:hypothetical protein ETSB_0235 [cyanobacterium endosymbiont of Epithemia turgida isolate EtSB Lake Yunoko]|nr:hypothetical protein ETSB_0235 [cyanobacterium endosymbiont of Epithemia turgida isolate EtSB Lake Yunoko]